MIKKMISLLTLILIFMHGSANAQTIPLNQKQWYQSSEVGENPPSWSPSAGSGKYVMNTGLIDPYGNMCIATSDSNCCMCINPSSFGWPILTDDSAFTPTTTKIMMSGFEYDDITPDSVDENDAGAARMSANRNIYVNIRDNAGNERGANVNSSNQLEVHAPQAPWYKFNDDYTGQCVSITSSSVQYTLPGSSGDWYCISAQGNTAYILCGSNPTATTSVGGYSFFVTSGDTKCRRLQSPKCAVIGTTSVGSICFEGINE